MEQFGEMPDIEKEELEKHGQRFKAYLFFETIKPGVKNYTCSRCGKSFKRGAKVLLRTVTPNDSALTYALGGEYAACPECGAKAEIKNKKRANLDSLYEIKGAVYFLAAGKNDVWLRCFLFWKNYKDSITKVERKEYTRYRLRPGNAQRWECAPYGGGWNESRTLSEPFVYNHGTWCEKYDYQIFVQENAKLNLQDTFLKYSAAERYPYSYSYYIKYLCWYAEHPQIEILVKTGHTAVISEMIFNNTDNRRLMDWSKNTPWELFRLPKERYRHWKTTHGGNIDVLKVYNTMKGKTDRDMDTAADIYKLEGVRCNALSRAQSLVRSCRLSDTSPRELIKYFDKISRESAGSCHLCPGITTREAYSLWCDYTDMAKKLDILGKVPVFPKNLKEAHDGLVRRIAIKQCRENAKKYRQAAKVEGEKLEKKFKKVRKIYERLKPRYEYTSGEYSIVVPESIADIIYDSLILNHCSGKTDRYFERIENNETYIFFLRKAKHKNVPWYTLEVEPCAAIRQKRTTDDRQDEELKKAEGFLREWQREISKKLTAKDIRAAKAARAARIREYGELRKRGAKIHAGDLKGALLADVLEADLMENNFEGMRKNA